MTERGSIFKKSLFSVGGLVLVLLIVVLVNFIFSRVNLRWDATEDKLYSLSAGTRKILSNLNEDVVAHGQPEQQNLALRQSVRVIIVSSTNRRAANACVDGQLRVVCGSECIELIVAGRRYGPPVEDVLVDRVGATTAGTHAIKA